MVQTGTGTEDWTYEPRRTKQNVGCGCIKHVITARRVCIARTMPWQDVCPSVCPSRWYSI